MLDHFFLRGAPPPDLLWAQHDPWLVGLSVVVAVLASITALYMATLAQRASTRAGVRLARASGALALGGGIWAMHFIGMLAFASSASHTFHAGITALSMLPGLFAAWVALGLLMQRAPTRGALVLSGLLMGAGIGAMHYLGMAASHLGPEMRYDPLGFALSVVVAAVLATASLWVRFGIARGRSGLTAQANAIAGVVMGLAITVMHYTGMAALRWTGPVDAAAAMASPENVRMALLVAVVTLGLSGLVLAANVILRYRNMLRRVQESESRMRAVAETTVDGIITINAQGIVQTYNPAAERILGWSAQEMIGQNIARCMPEPHRSAHDGYLSRFLHTGEAHVIGRGREVMALRKDGTQVPIQLSVGRIQVPGAPLFVGFLSDISRRRAMEDSLRSSEEQLRSLIANIPGVAFRCAYDRDWSMLFVSDAVLALTGWPPEEFTSGRITFTQLTHPDEVDRLWREVSSAIEQHRPYQAEFRMIDRSGQLRWVSESGRAVTDEHGHLLWIDGVIMDITTFRMRNAEFGSTVTALNRALAVIEFDLQGRVLHANDNFLSLMGYRLDEVVGQHHRMFCEPQYVQSPDYQRFWQQLLAGEIEAGEYLRLAKDGRKVWIQATYNPIFDAHGQPFKIMKFATDLTSRRAMEQELRAARDKAEMAAAARSTFLANMSHEIRTPMNAIIGFTEALLDTPMDATQRRQLGTVHHAARSMLRLLNDILDTAKLEKGAVELETQDFSIRELCEQILASLRIHATKKGLGLTCDLPPHVPAYLRGDPLRLQQILLNLLGNALKFTAQGHVRLRLDYQDGTLVMDVEDTGIGIAPEHQARIFDPFAQADASTTRQFGGTGLGTTIARQLAELMGGSIGLRSTPGLGSTFTVRLPLPEGQAAAALPTQRHLQLPPLRVLAVDDVPHNIELLQLQLAHDRHQVVVARDGEEAVAAFQQGRFDVVLMDLQMPGMDGLEATRRIRAFEQAERRKPVPVIALSASVLEQDRRNARAAGMDGFASKPLEPQRLMQEIARLVGLDSQNTPPAPPTAQCPPVELHGAPSQHPPAIDWEHGARLWTQLGLLRDALHRFMIDHEATPARLQALFAQGDWAGIRALAHRLRGTSGNLGLMPLHQLAAQIETAAHRTANAPDATDPSGASDLPDLLARLPQALLAVREALAREAQAPAAPSTDSIRHPGTWSPATRDQAHRAAQALAQALVRAELAQQPLDTLNQLLPAAAMEPLQDAIDRFDFDLALQALDDLQTHWIAPAPLP